MLSISVYATDGTYEGPTTTTDILVDKLVARPQGTTEGTTEWEYVDNISSSDHTFSPGNPIFYRVTVKNVSNHSLTNVTIKDYVPSYLEPYEGHGSYDSATREITIAAGDFAADQSKTYTINMRINNADQLPSDQSLLCPINKVKAYNDQVSDEDQAQVCIEKEIPAPTTTTQVTEEKVTISQAEKIPSAGPEENIAMISAIAAVMAVAGIRLASVEGKHLKKHSN